MREYEGIRKMVYAFITGRSCEASDGHYRPFESYSCRITFSHGPESREAFFEMFKFDSDNRVGYIRVTPKSKKCNSIHSDFYRGSAFEKWAIRILLKERKGLKLEGKVRSETEVGRIISDKKANKMSLIPEDNAHIRDLFYDIDSMLEDVNHFSADREFNNLVTRGLPEILGNLNHNKIISF